METALYDKIGMGYNATRKADPYISSRLLHLLSPEKKAFYLDIGCGTGNYTIELNDRGLKFYGIDPSDKMLEEAKFKSQKIKWLNGSAESISAESKLFSGAIATLSIHHWSDLQTSFKEISRVLKPRSRFVIFTALPEQMETYWLTHYFPTMMKKSTEQMPSLNMIRENSRYSGFTLVGSEKYFIQDDLKDLFLYFGKNRPDVYLDESIRKGISSFSHLADKEEIDGGLKHLALDIVTGTIRLIRKKYSDSEGDYMFLILERN